jgi:hypothetical protein
MAEAYFARLTSAPYKRFVQIGEGTHSVMLEKNRMQFFHEILGFLTESDAIALKSQLGFDPRAYKLRPGKVGFPATPGGRGIRS